MKLPFTLNFISQIPTNPNFSQIVCDKFDFAQFSFPRSHRKVNSILCDEVDNFSRMEVWVADEKVPAEDLNKTAAEFFAGREDSPVRVRAFQQKVSLS